MSELFNARLADRIKSSYGQMLEFAAVDFRAAVKNSDWRALEGVIEGACRDALQLGMLEIREHGVTDRSLEFFGTARDYVEALAIVPPKTILGSSLVVPMYCCLLSQDIDCAKQISGYILAGRTSAESGSRFDAHAQILAATINDDTAAFEKALSYFEGFEKQYWWEKQEVYFRLYRAVLDRHQDTFVTELSKAVDAFGLRRTDTKFGDEIGEFGGLEYNQFAIDFMAVGIANLAASVGLETQLDDVFFPQELVVSSGISAGNGARSI